MTLQVRAQGRQVKLSIATSESATRNQYVAGTTLAIHAAATCSDALMMQTHANSVGLAVERNQSPEEHLNKLEIELGQSYLQAKPLLRCKKLKNRSKRLGA